MYTRYFILFFCFSWTAHLEAVLIIRVDGNEYFDRVNRVYVYTINSQSEYEAYFPGIGDFWSIASSRPEGYINDNIYDYQIEGHTMNIIAVGTQLTFRYNSYPVDGVEWLFTHDLAGHLASLTRMHPPSLPLHHVEQAYPMPPNHMSRSFSQILTRLLQIIVPPKIRKMYSNNMMVLQFFPSHSRNSLELIFDYRDIVQIVANRATSYLDITTYETENPTPYVVNLRLGLDLQMTLVRSNLYHMNVVSYNQETVHFLMSSRAEIESNEMSRHVDRVLAIVLRDRSNRIESAYQRYPDFQGWSTHLPIMMQFNPDFIIDFFTEHSDDEDESGITFATGEVILPSVSVSESPIINPLEGIGANNWLRLMNPIFLSPDEVRRYFTAPIIYASRPFACQPQALLPVTNQPPPLVGPPVAGGRRAALRIVNRRVNQPSGQLPPGDTGARGSNDACP